MRTGLAMPQYRARAVGPLLLAFILLLTAWRSDAAPAVYRISNASAPPSYVVGTMHSDDSRVMALLPSLEQLLDRVDVLAIEVVPDAVTLLAAGTATLLPADQSLRSLVGERRFAAVQALLEARGLPAAAIDRLKPWAVAVMLGMPGLESGRFLDMELYLAAVHRERDVVGLETAAEQLAVFGALDPALQLALLDDAIKNADVMPTMLEALTAAYLAGDLDLLADVARRQQVDLPAGLKTWFDDALLAQRNRRMVERITGRLTRESVLIAVGALHLGGDDGVLNGIKARGFQVERMPDDWLVGPNRP